MSSGFVLGTVGRRLRARSANRSHSRSISHLVARQKFPYSYGLLLRRTSVFNLPKFVVSFNSVPPGLAILKSNRRRSCHHDEAGKCTCFACYLPPVPQLSLRCSHRHASTPPQFSPPLPCRYLHLFFSLPQITGFMLISLILDCSWLTYALTLLPPLQLQF